jgi:hypothetical protein
MASVGIDISGFQPNAVPGDWLFVVVKLTEGQTVVNPKADAQWRFAQGFPFRGFYHYARPAVSDGRTQAQTFAVQALARGFRKGIDWWQLDCEGDGNDGVNAGQWTAFVNDFFATGRQLLGGMGFLYASRAFMPDAFGALCARYPWWLPDYGPFDNGQLHPLPPGVEPVIHQFTGNGLDLNVIHNPQALAVLLVAANPKATVPTLPKVRQEFDPAPRAISLTVFQRPTGGNATGGYAAAQLNSDGGVYCDPPDAYLGGVNGKSFFVGRTPALIRQPTAAEGSPGTGYVIVDTAGECYRFPTSAK